MNAPLVQTAGRALEVSRVWKSYGPGPYVVSDVSFDLPPGEFLTLLGPSGSGKTTTLMMVAGFETPTRGAIRVGGQDIARQPPERRQFGIVFQGYALFPHMSVLENVAFPLRMKHVPSRDRRRRAMDMLDKVGLASFADRRPRALSGGQQQRVALARALVFEPDALLLDEPLGALDRQLREQLQAEIKDIQRRIGISILLVTHDQEEAMMMSDRIAVMAHGRIEQIGAPADVYLHPSTPFVAGFLGETNLLPATCRGVDGGHVVVQFRDGSTGRARLPRLGRVQRAGDTTQVSIRPERIRILGNATPAETDTVLDGTLIRCTFLGRHARCVVQAGGQQIIVSAGDWPALSTLEPGAPIRLGWCCDDAQSLVDPTPAPQPDEGARHET